MPLDLHPIYYTETMVKILREQGSPHLAAELAEQVLQRSPGHVGVEKILSELKEEARRAFERFKNSSRAAQEEEKDQALNSSETLSTQAPQAEEFLQKNVTASSDAPYAHRVEMLQTFLDRIQQRQKQDEND